MCIRRRWAGSLELMVSSVISMLSTLQIYISVKPMQEGMDNAVSNIQRSIEDIGIWMKKTFLKLNDDKTEVFMF